MAKQLNAGQKCLFIAENAHLIESKEDRESCLIKSGSSLGCAVTAFCDFCAL
jgi:hypothetical protein